MLYFVFAAALLHLYKVELDAKNEVHGVTKDSLFYFHPAPKFVKECEINILAYNPQCMYHLSCQVNIYFVSLDSIL